MAIRGKSLYDWCKENNKGYLLDEWDNEKNNALTPHDVTYAKNTKVYWKCDKGHSWEAIIYSRTGKNNTGCPYCSNKKVLVGYNDLATTNPELLKEWDYEKNKLITPYNITYGYKKKVFWKCGLEHSWDATLTHRFRGDGCPYCSGHRVLEGFNDLASKKPELLKDWDYDKNNILPTEVSSKSGKRVHWKCSECDYNWITSIAHRSNGSGCKKCSENMFVSFGEKAVFYYISKYLKTEIKENIKIPNTKNLEIDIYIPSIRVGIEFDGYRHKVERDKLKNKICKENNIKLIRLRCWELPDLKDSSIDYIYQRGDNELTITIKEVLYNEFNLKEIDIDVERDRQEIEELIQYKKLSNSLLNTHPEILKEWDYKKNKIEPNQVTRGTQRKVWWKCVKNHSWYATISDRLNKNKNGCPYCSNQKVLAGYNDLATTNKELLKEWNYEKNIIKPTEVVAGSDKRIHWICEKGHEYESRLVSRKQGTGCPYCSGQKVLKGYNDLATTNSEILDEWDYITNKINPEEVSRGSNRVVNWVCEKGHSYKQKINEKAIKKSGCPYCSNKRILTGFNDLGTTNKELLKEWDYGKNNKLDLNPETITKGSHKRAWWICKKGHSWDAVIYSRVSGGNGCPYCSGRKVIEK